MSKVKITWNGMGGELDSRIADDDVDGDVANTMIRMLQECQIVTVGDSFIIEEIE